MSRVPHPETVVMVAGIADRMPTQLLLAVHLPAGSPPQFDALSPFSMEIIGNCGSCPSKNTESQNMLKQPLVGPWHVD